MTNKRILCFLFIINIFFVLSGLCFAQSITWQRTYNRLNGWPDEAYDICQSTDGNFYLAGSSYLGGIYVLKINQYGDTIWTRAEIGGIAYAVTASGDGGCVLTGLRSNKSFTVKYSASGVIVWNKEYSGTQMYNQDIVATIDGYVICGTDWATYFDGYYAKVDLQGNLVWEKYYPSDDSRSFNSVINSGDDGYVFTGKIDTTGYPSQATIMKTDNNGNILWEKRYLMNGIGAVGIEIQKISQGFLIGGRTGDSTYTIERAFILRVDNNGNFINQKVFISNEDEYFQHISVATENRYVMSIFRYGSGWTIYGKILVIDSIGNIIREKYLNDSNQIVLNSSLCLPNGDILFAGMSEFDNITHEDVFAARTDSNLNVPPPIGIQNTNSGIIKSFKLLNNYPNPFNSTTTIQFEIAKPSNITIKIFDINGRLVTKLLCNSYVSAGNYKIKWEAINLPSGLYFITLETEEGFKDAMKIILVK